MSKKLYYSHQFITLPDKNGFCKFGISQYALKHFVRFHRINFQNFSKTKYSINNNFLINLFLKQTLPQYEQLRKIKQQKLRGNFDEEQQSQPLKLQNLLSISEQMQYNRFVIKKGQPFAILQTYQFDLELTAPVDMRVIEHHYENFYWGQILTLPYLFEVQCLNQQQLTSLQSQEEYYKNPKFFQTC